MILNGALPIFAHNDGELALVVVRGLFIAALFSGFGALAFEAWVKPYSPGRQQGIGDASLLRGEQRLAQISSLSAIALALAWLVLQTGLFIESNRLSNIIAASPGVLLGTRFGLIVGLQLLALLGSLAALGPSGTARPRLALALSAVATALQSGHGHALAMEHGPSLLLVSDTLHVLCAGAWLGGLAPLFLFVRYAPAQSAAAAARRFSPLGTLCVTGLLVSAAFQGWVLIGGIPGLIGSAYGWLALVKLILFAMLLGFAAANRFRLTPLMIAFPEHGRSALLRSIGLETCLGVIIVFAAVSLTSYPPAIHAQPVWPFAYEPSLTTIQEDPEFRQEVKGAIAVLVVGLTMLLAGLVVRQVRWMARGPAILVGAILVWFAIPHFDLLFVEASPTSFYRSPTGFAATAISEGAALYPEHCAACHGPDGKGDGAAGKALPVPPADLTAPHLWAHSDGEMFWWLAHGIAAPNGKPAMPGFADSLSEDQRWSLIDFIRAHNAGLSRASSGAWPFPVQAPAFQAVCEDGKTISSEDLRGKTVRLVLGDGDGEDLSPLPTQQQDQVVTILAPSRDKTEPLSQGQCVIEDGNIGQAYGIVAGISGETIAHSRFLIDANGWLRAVWSSEPRSNGNLLPNLADPLALQAEIARIIANPMGAAVGPVHHH